jgi:hypothetical protein
MESANWGSFDQIGIKKKFFLREDTTTIGTKGDKKSLNNTFKLEELIFKIDENSLEKKQICQKHLDST